MSADPKPAAAPREKRSPKRGAVVNPYLTATSPDDLGPADRIAYDIVDARRDLLPSVAKIMDAGLGDDGALAAITRFRDALDRSGDPNRDPAVAIAGARRPD